MKQRPFIFGVLELILTGLLTLKFVEGFTGIIKDRLDLVTTKEIFLSQIILLGFMYLLSLGIVYVIEWMYHTQKAETIVRKRNNTFFKKYDEDVVALARSFRK